jgi:hypothetical protein
VGLVGCGGGVGGVGGVLSGSQDTKLALQVELSHDGVRGPLITWENKTQPTNGDQQLAGTLANKTSNKELQKGLNLVTRRRLMVTGTVSASGHSCA